MMSILILSILKKLFSCLYSLQVILVLISAFLKTKANADYSNYP